MTPDFTAALAGGVVFGLAMLVFIGWRFGAANALIFAIMAGLFCAMLDFLSSFSEPASLWPRAFWPSPARIC